ncbi:MAG: response regulator [Lachnospiraceae bacterium]|nr:response regulator [Lachnospiraceae bacterium]
MMKRNPIRIGIAVLFLAVITAGIIWNVRTFGAEKETYTVNANGYPVGGGYAASNQIPGAYFLPVLYDASNGLPTSEANCILAASDGYIWIGGYSGIVKYDGLNFEKMSVTDGLTSGRDLFEDRDGRIWVATNDHGVVVIDGADRVKFTKDNGMNSNSIRTFAQDADGNVFIGSTAGVSYVDVSMKLHNIDDNRLNNARILRLVSDEEGTVYGHTGDGNVFTVSTDGVGAFYRSSDLGMKKVTTILPDPEHAGMLFFGTIGHSVYYGSLSENAANMKRIDTAPAQNIHWMHYACGRLWVSSVSVAGYVDEYDRFIPFESLPVKDSFEMMTSDYQGNMWFASSRYGVMKLAANNFLDITGAAGLDPEVINATAFREGNLYIGTDSGLRIIDEDYRIRENYVTEYFGESRIRCIMNDSRGNTWFSTFTGGLGLVCLTVNGKLINYTYNNGLPSNEIRCTCEMKDGTLVVGTNAGIALLKNGRVTETYGFSSGMKNTVVLTVCEGEGGEILAGTDGDGIYGIKNGILRHIGIEDGLDSDVIMRLKKDDYNGVVWVITSSMVEYIRNGVVTKVTAFPYNNNFDVIPADNGKLWFLSSRGIYVMSAADVLNDQITEYILFEKVNGLTSMPVSHCYNGTDDSGYLYIAGQTGVSVINTNNLYDFSSSIITGVRSIYYDGVEILPDESGVYNLPSAYGRMQINPAILDYTLSNPLVRVCLEGMNDEGITAHQSSLASLEYTGLKYGDYSLHIRVLDENNGRILSDSLYHIRKAPAFFERMSVRIILMILALAAIGIAVWRVLTGTVIRKQYLQIREARDEADRANAAKSRFLANMSHEIRTPINTIMGMDEMILRENTQNVSREYSSAVTGYARNIKYASESLLGLINDLLDISKIESGSMHLVEQEYDTAELLRGVIFMIRDRAEEKKLYFDLDIDETLPKRLYGDGGKVKQIILNILTNAVKYTDEGGFTLSVKVIDRNETSAALRISVRDTGIGIKPEEIDKLFSAYARLDEVRNSNIEGTGLGLDISKQFTDMMGGRLWCESVYGEGSEFLLEIRQKIADAAKVGVFHEKVDDSAAGNYKPQFIAPDADILVVDDNPMNLNVIKGLLGPTKIFVTTASSGEDCLEKIDANDFNVVLLDHMMPGMDGIETLEKIRKDHPDLPVYALTANATAGGEAFYLSKGFNGYLTKPIDIVAVEHAIMRHLPEHIMLKPSDEDAVQNDTILDEDLRWLENAEGISVPEGIANCGGASQFVSQLKYFADNIDDNSALIEKAYEDDDIKLATVKIHALKTSSRIIGALKLADECRELEEAGNSKDTDYINTRASAVIEHYREFKTILGRLKNDKKDMDESGDKPEITAGELDEAYRTLKDCIIQMDYDAVETVLTQLKKYRLPGKDEDTLKALEKAFGQVNWEAMEEVIGNV